MIYYLYYVFTRMRVVSISAGFLQPGSFITHTSVRNLPHFPMSQPSCKSMEGLPSQGINMNQYPTVHGKIIDSKSARLKRPGDVRCVRSQEGRHLHRFAPYRFHTPKKSTTKTNQSLSPCAFNSVMLRIISSPGIPHWYISLGPGNAKLEADPPNLAFGKC